MNGITELEKMVSRTQAIVVNSAMEIMSVVPWDRAMTPVVSNAAYTLIPRSDGTLVRSQFLALPKPLVVSLNKYVPKHRTPQRTNDSVVTNEMVHERDQYTCQYCGMHVTRSEATVDHIFPRSRGGRSTWGNLCTACKRCNNRKANRTPQEAGMVVPVIPDWGAVNKGKALQDALYEIISDSWK